MAYKGDKQKVVALDKATHAMVMSKKIEYGYNSANDCIAAIFRVYKNSIEDIKELEKRIEELDRELDYERSN